ncbi:MAG: aspartate carbamoyltransferase regulatory subunit [Candidatus Bathyarchaeota archaeon]|nr:aspartate carbamoyltransferase regulatory subunit [Candidatus Bathyarchaeota archaeon]
MSAIRIGKIQNGTVIDHITAGKGAKIIEALNLAGSDKIVSMLMNVQSKKLGKKDVVKIEGVHLDPKQIAPKISPFAPKATVNLIKNSKVSTKVRLESLKSKKS